MRPSCQPRSAGAARHGACGQGWEFRLCPESNGEPGVLIDRSDIIRIAFLKVPFAAVWDGTEGPGRRQEGQAGGSYSTQAGQCGGLDWGRSSGGSGLVRD